MPYYFKILFLFGGTGGLTQGLVFARQALYHLSHSASFKIPFLLNYFFNFGFFLGFELRAPCYALFLYRTGI
jgi:hypothetical protein